MSLGGGNPSINKNGEGYDGAAAGGGACTGVTFGGGTSTQNNTAQKMPMNGNVVHIQQHDGLQNSVVEQMRPFIYHQQSAGRGGVGSLKNEATGIQIGSENIQ